MTRDDRHVVAHYALRSDGFERTPLGRTSPHQIGARRGDLVRCQGTAAVLRDVQLREIKEGDLHDYPLAEKRIPGRAGVVQLPGGDDRRRWACIL